MLSKKQIRKRFIFVKTRPNTHKIDIPRRAQFAMQPRADAVSLLNLHHQRVLRPANGAVPVGSNAGTFEYEIGSDCFRAICTFCVSSNLQEQRIAGPYCQNKADAKQAAAALALEFIELATQPVCHDAPRNRSPGPANSDDEDMQPPVRNPSPRFAASAVFKLIQLHKNACAGQDILVVLPQPVYIITQHALPENGNTFHVDARFMFRTDTAADPEPGMSHSEGPTLEKAVELAATKALELISEKAASRH